MLSEKPWNREALLLLLAGMLVSWCVGSLLSIALEQFLPLGLPQKPFYRFLVNTLSLHGAALFLIHPFLRLHQMTWSQFFGLTRPGLFQAILFSVIICILVLPVILTLNDWSSQLINYLTSRPAAEEPAMKILKSTVGIGQQVCFGVAAIVIAPVAEESIFRGILYPYLKQQGRPRLAILITTLVWAAIHMNLAVFVPLSVLSVVLIFVYEKTDKLIAPIITHALFNATNFFLSLFEPEVTRWFHHFRH